ncbi:MAG: hypothetical protein IJT90_07865 [Bacteroidaceae bacterium]|nr:hypothetical protein [Bacteroidaceae bacterium]
MKTLIKAVVFALLLTSALSSANAQDKKEKKYDTEVWGYIVDDATQQPVQCKVSLLLAKDSSVVITQNTSGGDYSGKPRAWFVFILTQPGEYIIKAEADGYETTYTNWSVPKLYKGEKMMNLSKPWYIHRIKEKKNKDQQLGEVVVKATKVKFYIKGDTVVYNADAFELAEGSMLDALIKQLPGVELKEGGDILVNGRHVDELLLNGKDFLNSDRKVMLENLPTYMVKNIKVYEKKDFMLEQMGDTVTKKLAMDVRLKKEYSIGLIGNVEAGIGTDHRFLGRLFGLRFTPNSSLNFYANANNINQAYDPGNKGDWSPLQQATSVYDIYKTGANCQIDWSQARYKGKVSLLHVDNKGRHYTNSENFLSSGNTFGRSFNNVNYHNTSFSTDHSFWTGKDIDIGSMAISFISLHPKLQYDHFTRNSGSGSATADEDVYGSYGKEWRDSITAPNAGQLLRTHALNRLVNSSKGSGHKLNVETEGDIFFGVAHNDILTLCVSDEIKFTDSRDKLFDHYNLQYLKDNTTDFRNRYNLNDQQGFSNMLELGTVQMHFFKHHLDFWAKYRHSYQRETQTRSLYLLNKLDAWGEQTEHELGELPSVDEMLLALDNGNSYHQREDMYKHEVQLQFRAFNYLRGDKNKPKITTQFKYEPTLSFISERLQYERGALDTLARRHSTVFVHGTTLDIWPTDKGFPWPWTSGFHYQLKHHLYDLNNLVGYRDDSNPLNIMLGNPHLKAGRTHSFYMYLNSNMKKQRQLNTSVTANIYRHRLAMGYTYDTQTGVRTVTPDNINGNWDLTGQLNYSARFDKDGKFTYSTSTDATYINSVDLIEQLRSEVHTTNINETLKLNARFSAKASLNFKADLHWQHSTSGRENFSTINVADFDYGLGGVFQIPLGFQFSTDMTMYSRRGYNDHSMNTNELVWNARLSRHFAKAGLTVMLDAFDLFGQLSNVRRTINAQGRTETWSNVTPQYAMLHVLYRLNKKPKKTE